MLKITLSILLIHLIIIIFVIYQFLVLRYRKNPARVRTFLKVEKTKRGVRKEGTIDGVATQVYGKS